MDKAKLRPSPQGKLLSAVALIVGIVLGAPQSLLTVACVIALVVMACVVLDASPVRLFVRSLVVLPVAGAMALFTPLRYVGAGTGSYSWADALLLSAPQMLQLVLSPWLCVLVMLALSQACSFSELVGALQRLHLPQALTLLLAFMYRYVELMRIRLTSLNRALTARAPSLSPYRRVLLYGNLAGSLIIRTQSQSERIHAAMLARGFNGELPTGLKQLFNLGDAALLTTSIVLGAAFSFV
ncbi:MAG: energy-coupling factor transporter transmembrane protein EcfT [Coriobacteriia bacterium]|nr:energy-coupling factor transporter transmembrane protein EcfT [Coriobacteriia bacterium]